MMKYLTLMGCVAMLVCGCATVQPLSEREDFLAECQKYAQDRMWSDAELVETGLTTREYTKNYRVVYADAKVLSYYLEEMEYTGGAHGMTTVTTGVINRVTGKTMTLADILPTSKHAALLQALQTALIARLGSADALLDEVFIPTNFYVAKDGLHFVYNVYEVACYAAGTLDIVIDPATL